MKVVTRQIGLGMIQQMQHVCPECRGSGEEGTRGER
ncbi:Chaperone protein dnaJ 3 [Trichinella patagoniensis]|uniref:Chaperone protein dnaJ 3 n=1 Tax=Trichinella patagoniensis TaxID=990121 RepID=A0A0V0WRT9_9BILA|nr:Chaperone protein dnaJ 3 [Trichinella patagoniensis]